MKIPLYTHDGSKKGDLEVSEKVFGKKVNKGLIHRILLLQLNNKRHPISHTLTKGEVSGGGKKPHAQKHTGWARQGSTRNPHWRGGGVAFGPRNVKNYSTDASKKERRIALLGALSEKFTSGNIAAFEGYASTLEKPKTKEFATMLKKLPFAKKVLFVLPGKDEVFVKSSRNIKRVKSVMVNYLNIADVLSYTDVVFHKESLPKIEEIFKI